MSRQAEPAPFEDSLERVERIMAMEEWLINQVKADPNLSPDRRKRLIRGIEQRIERVEFGDDDDFDDDDFAALVRNLGPRSPRGQAGAAARPEEPFSNNE
jgi:hypothetical protein